MIHELLTYVYYSCCKLDFKDKYNKMGLLDNISNLSSKVGGTLGSAAVKINGLTTIAKGVLCLPTMISGLVSSIPGIINGVVSGIGNAANAAVGAAAGMIGNAVNNAVNGIAGAITGAITGGFAKIDALLGAVAATIIAVKAFIDFVKDAVEDVKSFVENKENCNFAAATMAKCIILETVNNLTNKSLRDAASGAVSVSSLSNSVTSSGTVQGVVNRYADKQVAQLHRASSVLGKASKII